MNVPRFPLIGPLCRTRLPPSLRERTDLTLSETLVDETSVKVTASVHETPNKMKIADDVGPRHPSVTVARVQRYPPLCHPDRSVAKRRDLLCAFPRTQICAKSGCSPLSSVIPTAPPAPTCRWSAVEGLQFSFPIYETLPGKVCRFEHGPRPNQANDKGPKAGNGLLCSLKKDRQITAPYVDFLYG